MSYSRNPNSIPESLPAIPSVGSPGSAGPSPHPNSSLSQPTSVPPPDQVSNRNSNFYIISVTQNFNTFFFLYIFQLIPVISPIPPPSNIQPSTPIEHLDKNTPAATPTDPQDSKSATASPYVAHAAPLSVEPPPTNNANSSNNNGNNNATDQVKVTSEPNIQTNATNANVNNSNSDGASVSGNSSANANNSSGGSTMNSDLKNILSLMKRPILSSRDYENIIDDDYMPHQLLYDYSTWDAW